ncbi:LOW QUALITY PROTEIN: UPF0561 protein C2orf68 homolog [Hyperolius riggenbachi]|uniref:LOW QUALITY PROTEIN: UPF0561 protein C2orf68 homolog n=1 Tax=Hyperolius riggenbachi TaxID=752182 RepID=UPI0035A326DF
MEDRSASIQSAVSGLTVTNQHIHCAMPRSQSRRAFGKPESIRRQDAGGAGEEEARKMEEEEAEHRDRAVPGGRLDMSHGFVRHIRRNQIARDDYDKEVKQAKEKQRKRYTPRPSRPKKPDLQVYHPRQRESHPNAGLAEDDISEHSSSSDHEQSGNQLFCLEFEADGGKITSIIVYEDDDAEEIATKISIQNQLEARMKEALRRRIQEEITKRRVHR